MLYLSASFEKEMALVKTRQLWLWGALFVQLSNIDFAWEGREQCLTRWQHHRHFTFRIFLSLNYLQISERCRESHLFQIYQHELINIVKGKKQYHLTWRNNSTYVSVLMHQVSRDADRVYSLSNCVCVIFTAAFDWQHWTTHQVRAKPIQSAGAWFLLI